jgi:hypothetical protein
MTPRNNPEELRVHQHRGGSLKSADLIISKSADRQSLYRSVN